MHSLKLIKSTVHLDNGYGKPVCDCNARGKTVRMGEGIYSCEGCKVKYEAAKEKQNQIDSLNRLEQDILKQLYVYKNKPRNLDPETEKSLKSQQLAIQKRKTKIINSINTVESEIMSNLTAHQIYNQCMGEIR
jgi:ribosomal protein L37AE/L43A